ncbi:hypothetical protein BH18VER1_BH18VER1_15590 [soil metagenome]
MLRTVEKLSGLDVESPRRALRVCSVDGWQWPADSGGSVDCWQSTVDGSETAHRPCPTVPAQPSLPNRPSPTVPCPPSPAHRPLPSTHQLLNSSTPQLFLLRILVTGGTFDKEYDELNGSLFFKDTHLGEMLRLGRSRVDVTIRTVMMIDSLEMTDADRGLIVQNCLQCAEDRIVITHGTDTMTDTAAAIARDVTGKTVVLTGAMIPYAFGSSDGLFNLGSALSFVQILPAGVYVAMNGKCFPWDRVHKNRERGEFEEVG